MRKKDLRKGNIYQVDLGPKFKGSIVKAKYTGTEIVPAWDQDEELPVIVPLEVIKDKCGFANMVCDNAHNMLVNFSQILKLI